MRKLMILFVLMLALLMLAGCGGTTDSDSDEANDAEDARVLTEAAGAADDEEADSSEGVADDAAAAVEAFWEAKVASDADTLAGLICAEREGELEMQAASFASVEASLEGMACVRAGDEGDDAIVTCEGHVAALYGTETREIPLGTSRAREEDGEWKWCGEAETAE
ncbi:MAG: hypothetical protein SF029_08735 [bacterium]|nr:hypothetical protein [bacterium]